MPRSRHFDSSPWTTVTTKIWVYLESLSLNTLIYKCLGENRQVGKMIDPWRWKWNCLFHSVRLVAESTAVVICFDHVLLAYHVAISIKLKWFSFFSPCVALWLIQTDLAYLIFQGISLLSILLTSTYGKKRIGPSSIWQEILCCSYLMQSEVRLYLFAVYF